MHVAGIPRGEGGTRHAARGPRAATRLPKDGTPAPAGAAWRGSVEQWGNYSTVGAVFSPWLALANGGIIQQAADVSGRQSDVEEQGRSLEGVRFPGGAWNEKKDQAADGTWSVPATNILLKYSVGGNEYIPRKSRNHRFV